MPLILPVCMMQSFDISSATYDSDSEFVEEVRVAFSAFILSRDVHGLHGSLGLVSRPAERSPVLLIHLT